MRLLTHNYLQSNVKGTPNGYPLQIEATKITIAKSPINTDLVLKLLPKLKYDALVLAVKELQKTSPPPPESNSNEEDNNVAAQRDGTTNQDQDSKYDLTQIISQIPSIPETLPTSLIKSMDDQPPSSAASNDSPGHVVAADTTTDDGDSKPSVQQPTSSTSTSDEEGGGNPDNFDKSKNDNQKILQDLYFVLFDIHVEEGNLICPDTKRKFPIKQGIPNMILHADEI